MKSADPKTFLGFLSLNKKQLKLLAGGVAILSAAGFLAPVTASANVSASLVDSMPSKLVQAFPLKEQASGLVSAASEPRKQLPKQQPKLTYEVVRSLGSVVTTAYTPRPEENWGDPTITASGTKVHWGTLACSYELPFGTLVKIEGFGDKVFKCEDRGSAAFYFDIWHADLTAAYAWGRRTVRAWIVKPVYR